jgi:hypothetical protein
VLARTASATGARMAVAGAPGDQRVTLHAGRTTVGELQEAVRDLLRLKSTVRGAGATAVTSFSADRHVAAQAEALRLRQANAFLTALARTAGDFAAGRETAAVQTVRRRFQREHPEVSGAALEAIDADYLRQSLLVTPLSPVFRGQLERTGWVSLPVAWLSPVDQELLAAFGEQGAGRAVLEQSDPEAGGTAARAQYRLLYGDRWTDRMLLIQVGRPGEWTSAMLPSILFRQQDDSALYPEAAERPDDPDVWRRLPPRFETAGKDWDTVLTELAGTMEIKLAADSYARPWLFDAGHPLPEIAGIPLRDALDRLCRQHGYFWWKQNDWYLLRSRTGLEENRVAVPDRLLQRWTESARAHGELTEADLLQLAELSDEQLLTLDLQSRAPGGTELFGGGFDADGAALMVNGLSLLRSLPPAQRELALNEGVPALWLPPAQQNMFAAVAAQHGIWLLPEDAQNWSFQVRQSFSRSRTSAASRGSSAGSDVSGQISVEWHFGAGQTTRAEVTLSDRALHRTEDAAIPSEAR